MESGYRSLLKGNVITLKGGCGSGSCSILKHSSMSTESRSVLFLRSPEGLGHDQAETAETVETFIYLFALTGYNFMIIKG